MNKNNVKNLMLTKNGCFEHQTFWTFQNYSLNWFDFMQQIKQNYVTKKTSEVSFSDWHFYKSRSDAFDVKCMGVINDGHVERFLHRDYVSERIRAVKARRG